MFVSREAINLFFPCRKSNKLTISLFFILAFYLFCQPVEARYSSGTGEPNDPYQIATAEDLILLGETPEDYDKHFILAADIDLNPNLPGQKVFDRAIIAPDINNVEWEFQGVSFNGVFDGNGHNISNLTIDGVDYLGLFGKLASGAEVKDLGVVDVNITCPTSMEYVHNVGGLAGYNSGIVTYCYSSGSVNTVKNAGYVSDYVGGLVGSNDGNVNHCYSSAVVSGESGVGGLVGSNFSPGSITQSYSAGLVKGSYNNIGGLVGYSSGHVTNCYSTAEASGLDFVGGLVGYNFGAVNHCYCTGIVKGDRLVGGLVGSNYDPMWFKSQGIVTRSFWDIDISGQVSSAGGVGLTTEQMKDIQNYLDAGWDWIGEIENGTSEIWQAPEGGGYPVLAIFSGYMPIQLEGEGSPNDPYLISNTFDLGAMIYYSPCAHYRLAASIDLSDIRWGTSVIPKFAGTFDGNHMTISHLMIIGSGYLGLFGRLEPGAQVKNVGLLDVNISSSDFYVGVLAGSNGGDVTGCYSTGAVVGYRVVGGLLGYNGGAVSHCYSSADVGHTEPSRIVSSRLGHGGLVGYNTGDVTHSFSTGSVIGASTVGGLAGSNDGSIITSYSTGTVSGESSIGGLVGNNNWLVQGCYSTSAVSGESSVGGLVGSNTAPYETIHMGKAIVTKSFWDIDISGQTTSVGGTGKTTAEMQTAITFLEAGWDFVGEMANGTEDVWWILEGQDYPRLWWEADDN